MKVRRPEYRKKRWYKNRTRRRNPIGRVFRRLYEGFASAVIMPRLSCLASTAPSGRTVRWGGEGLYFDVVVAKNESTVSGLATTRVISQETVPDELRQSAAAIRASLP